MIVFATLLPHVRHALRVLRCHGTNDAAFKTVYQAVAISRSLYAAASA